MWFFAALFVASFIVFALLAPKPKLENARASTLADFRFPRSNEGDPVTRFYGTVKLMGPNTIGQCNFKTVAITKRVKTGLFSHKKQIQGYKYYTGLDLAWALGPCATLRRLWYGKNEIWNGCLFDGSCDDAPTVVTIDLPELLGGDDGQGGVGGELAIYGGSFNQERDPYLAANIDPNIPAYVGVAHTVFRDFYWGNTPNIDAISGEWAYFTNTLELTGGRQIMLNGLDANPVEVLYDIYVTQWGNLGIDATRINAAQWRTAAYTVFNEGNGISLECSNANQAGDVVKEILRQIRATMYEDPQTGLIDLKLIRRDYIVGDLPVLGPDQISDISNFTKVLWRQTFNRMRVKFTDRDNAYAQDAVATQDDFANIRFQGRVRATEMSFPGVYNAALANMIAGRELAQVNVPLYQCELQSNRVPSIMRPGDPFVLSWPEYELDGIVLRIRKFGIGSLREGALSMTVTQDDFATEDTVYSAPAPSAHADETQAPTDVAEFVLYELPYWMDVNSDLGTRDGFTRYGSFAYKPGPASMSYFGFIDDTPEDIEAIAAAPYSASAQLVAELAQFAGFVDGIVPTVVIQALTDADILTDGSEALIVSEGHGLFMLNGEILAYETFTDNEDGTYTLENVHRAMLDTGWVGGAADARIWLFDGQEGFFDTDVPVAPLTAYLLDRAWSGRSKEADADKQDLIPVGRRDLPVPPDMPTIDAARALGIYRNAGDTITVAWRERARSESTLTLENDATDAPEAGTTYRVEIAQGVTILASDTGIVGATHDIDIPSDASGSALVNVWAIRGGQDSYAPTSFPLAIISADALLVDGDPVFFDGDTVEF